MITATLANIRRSLLFMITLSLLPAALRAEKPSLPLVDAHPNGAIKAIADSSCVPACSGSCMSLKAVAVNGTSIAPSNCIHAMPGDAITSEIKISGWGSQLPLGVRAYQATILGEHGAVSGSRGTFLPVGWDAPIHSQICNPGSCTPQYPVCQPQGYAGICVGNSFDPTLGAFIDSNRADFIRFGSTLFGGIRLVSLDYIYGMTTLVSDGTPDTGVIRYGGTLVLVASEDACGTFEYAFQRDINYTLLHDPTPQQYTILPDTQSLIVSICTDDGIYCNGQENCDAVNGCVVIPVNCDDGVACTVDTCNESAHGCDHTPSDALCDDGDSCTSDTCTATGCMHQSICGSCCDQSDGTCTDGVPASTCTCSQCQWAQGVSCTATDCHPLFMPIPTVTSWGATVLVLALLIGAKICFARRHGDVARL
ncbi:MAG: hypothetical protein HY287_10865 [Planctomycetes bacterium]|nr:hypothetical protein [Planctomycetota bacterium]